MVVSTALASVFATDDVSLGLEHFLVCFSQEDLELEAHLFLTLSLLHLKLKVIDFTISHSGQRGPIPLPLYLVPLFDITYFEI